MSSRLMQRHHNLVYGYIIPVLAGLFLLLLGTITVFNAWYQYRSNMSAIMASEIQQLATIFEKINNTAGIINFDYQKNWINFLTIKKGGFVGSEVGTLNLMYPDKWEGPYLLEGKKDNPTIQEKEYQIVRTKDGYFIVPGEGVRLSNGKVIGKDIILDEQADIEKMMLDEQALRYQGKKLAARVPTGGKKEVVPLPASNGY